jgi:hypothetical protein
MGNSPSIADYARNCRKLLKHGGTDVNRPDQASASSFAQGRIQESRMRPAPPACVKSHRRVRFHLFPATLGLAFFMPLYPMAHTQSLQNIAAEFCFFCPASSAGAMSKTCISLTVKS